MQLLYKQGCFDFIIISPHKASSFDLDLSLQIHITTYVIFFPYVNQQVRGLSSDHRSRKICQVNESTTVINRNSKETLNMKIKPYQVGVVLLILHPHKDVTFNSGYKHGTIPHLLLINVIQIINAVIVFILLSFLLSKNTVLLAVNTDIVHNFPTQYRLLCKHFTRNVLVGQFKLRR